MCVCVVKHSGFVSEKKCLQVKTIFLPFLFRYCSLGGPNSILSGLNEFRESFLGRCPKFCDLPQPLCPFPPSTVCAWQRQKAWACTEPQEMAQWQWHWGRADESALQAGSGFQMCSWMHPVWDGLPLLQPWEISGEKRVISYCGLWALGESTGIILYPGNGSKMEDLWNRQWGTGIVGTLPLTTYYLVLIWWFGEKKNSNFLSFSQSCKKTQNKQ